jgi:hypothetical protein
MGVQSEVLMGTKYRAAHPRQVIRQIEFDVIGQREGKNICHGTIPNIMRWRLTGIYEQRERAEPNVIGSFLINSRPDYDGQVSAHLLGCAFLDRRNAFLRRLGADSDMFGDGFHCGSGAGGLFDRPIHIAALSTNRAPQQNSGNSENDSEKRRNGVSVVVHELAAASPIEFKRNSEIGDAFYRMLCAGLVFAAIYAGLKCLRTPNHPSGKNKKDDS